MCKKFRIIAAVLAMVCITNTMIPVYASMMTKMATQDYEVNSQSLENTVIDTSQNIDISVSSQEYEATDSSTTQSASSFDISASSSEESGESATTTEDAAASAAEEDGAIASSEKIKDDSVPPSENLSPKPSGDTYDPAENSSSEEVSSTPPPLINGSSKEPDNSSSVSEDASTTHTPDSSASEDESGRKDESESKPIEEMPSVYSEGAIVLYSFEQLSAIGSNQPVMSGDAIKLGTGSLVYDEHGEGVVYSLDATYRIANNIPLEGEWVLPDGFSGRFDSTNIAEDAPLYDSDSNTIYIYNNYQLITLFSPKATEEPVMSGDAHSEQFGMGTFLYSSGKTADDYLRYDGTHKYVISSSFTEQMPEIIAESLSENGVVEQSQLGGRLHVGQVYADIGGIRYILIGNAKQLEAIGTDKQVSPMLFVRTEVKIAGGLLGSHSTIVPFYPGDTDFNLTSFAGTGIAYDEEDINEDTIEFQYFKQDSVPTELWNPDFDDAGLLASVVGILSKVLDGVLSIVASADSEIVGLKNSNTAAPSIGASDGGWGKEPEYMSFDEVKNIYQSLKYSSDANYIIFRDIDLNELRSDAKQSNWTPLMFSGTMIGAKAAEGQMISDGSVITATERPTIYNLRVIQDTPLDVGEKMGVGFFATLYCDTVSGGTGTYVSNLVLNAPLVHTNTTEKTYDQTLINGLLTKLGALVGGLLDTILQALGLDVGMDEVLEDLLNARKTDPTALATGAFAGRIRGNVQVANCDVVNPNTASLNSATGGFVGMAEGETIYATESLGAVIDLLIALLNNIPGLGLGDIITVLLDNGLAIDKIIPQSYLAPEISGCHVTGMTGSLGNASASYVGGFAGQLIGTRVENSSVTATGLSIQSTRYGGGFAGLARDAKIEGLLSSVGVELVRGFLPQSLILNCSLFSDHVTVTGNEYLGGFVGALANSYAVNDTLSASISVNAQDSTDANGSGGSVGGFAGIATTGWTTNLGADENGNSLLGNVREILVELLSQNPSQAQMLLSLVGIAPSAVMGCQINENGQGTITVNGHDYIGGILGSGDGVYLTSSSQENIGELSALAELLKDEAVPMRNACANGVSSVTASGDYSGGIAGSLRTASVAGLLNDTIGVASFLGFKAEDVLVGGTAEGYAVSASRYAGGAFGEAVGGDVVNVELSSLQKVEAENYAGGFVGICGPGDLVGANGLTLNLLGLENLLKIDSLLSVIPGVKVNVDNCIVTGVDFGYTVQVTAEHDGEFVAGGFAAYCNSAQISNSTAANLMSVKAAQTNGYAGGFVGVSRTGGLADLANEEGRLEVGGNLIAVENLLGTVAYMVPTYTNCIVLYINDGYVRADVAGGFVGEMSSGKVDNRVRGDENYYAVYNIGRVSGSSYAGGFGGVVQSGALANAGGGISILNGSGLEINIGELLQLVEAYTPYVEYAGIESPNGFTVTAKELSENDSHAGSAGGFIGYASGAQISTCDVTRLKHTVVVPPEILEAADAPSYFDEEQSSYAVVGGRYAGGFIGCMDVGSAASVGEGLNVLGDLINLGDMLGVLNVAVTTVEHSDVYGGAGGYSVLSSHAESNPAVGHAGGFVGALYGGRIQDSNAHNFEYIIGQIAAGGYVGEMKPGDLANLLGNADVLNSLIDVDAALVSVLSTFTPTIRNSSVDAVPCGGAIRAQAASDTDRQNGMAGGYVGHNMGGSILGLDASLWKGAAYEGPTSICRADRIRSVYGAEYAGGFAGFIEAADTANAGGLSLLGGLVRASNILSLLDAIYPTHKNTATYGPLANLDYNVWNAWVEYVGQYGGYGQELAQNGAVENQQQLDEKLGDYIFGYAVVAGREEKNNMLPNSGGDAGGYVGLMRSGSLTNCMAYDLKSVKAMHGAGGYAGNIETNGAINFGSVSILGLNLNLGQLVNVAQMFVPIIRNSSVYGYTSGITVESTGLPEEGLGYAGGYAGCIYGAQIQANGAGVPETGVWTGDAKHPAPIASCDAHNLRRVTGKNAVGGYVGLASAASLASVNSQAAEGLLQGILDKVIASSENLVNLLPATTTVICEAHISPADAEWGFAVDGIYQNADGITSYAPYAGGFAGYVQAAVLGVKEAAEPVLSVEGLRSVNGGLYAGGFFGLADAAAVAEISGNSTAGGTSNILNQLISLGSIDALDVLRNYIYHAEVTGAEEGFIVQAHRAASEGILDEERWAGSAGGFGGKLLGGTLRNCDVTGLSTVQGMNCTGGFIGHMGKSGVVDVDSIGAVEKLLGATVGAADLFGSQVYASSATGVASGIVIKAEAGREPIAGGFVGYSDLGRIEGCNVYALKKISSEQIAGGFIGKTDMNYIISTQIQSSLLNGLLRVINALIRALYLGDTGLASIDLVDLDLGILEVKVLGDGNTLGVELMGLPITVALSKASENPELQTDVAIVTVGDSTLRLPCNKDGLTEESNAELENLEINLIKGNRTEVDNCSVVGVTTGYDVFGGGATQETNGQTEMGIAGGFVGYNHEGKVSNSKTELCDMVRGSTGKVGPFSGYNDLKSVYWFNTIQNIEGENNSYSIYRPFAQEMMQVALRDGTIAGTATKETVDGTDYNRYIIGHLATFKDYSDLENAKEVGEKTQRDLLAYVDAAQAVLMSNIAVSDNPHTTIPEPGEMADPCSETVELAIRKVWKDWFNLGKTRPQDVTINIIQQRYVKGPEDNWVLSEIQPESPYKTIILSENDQEGAWSAVWGTMMAVPVMEYDDANGNGIRDENEVVSAYYAYIAEEISIPGGYTVTYDFYDPANAGDYMLKITNTLKIPMPITGGTGDAVFVIVGVGVISFAIFTRKQRKEEKETSNKWKYRCR